ncbi:MAG: aspartate/glutamate racemase family protein [Lentisphaeria bacterium]|nr:aspartate/glutamate racemase family protein [Lentisphaeria bacterium]
MKRVIVCDSGLGGLNIAARFFGENKTAEKCELIYFNAYPSPVCGFNKLASEKEQEEVFRDVFEGMKKFSPDLCLIACNTLSIVYERLKKWYTPGFEVAGIVDAAVNGMFETLQKNPGSSMLILGTKSTVESGVYARKLIEKGIAPERIKGLGCPGLATLLESDPASEAVQKDIADYADRAAELFASGGQKIFCALCCTHFGFASPVWNREFARVFADFGGLVNPNDLLGTGFAAAEFSYRSKIDFFPGARESMSAYFEKNSPQIADALKTAVYDDELFNFTKGNI